LSLVLAVEHQRQFAAHGGGRAVRQDRLPALDAGPVGAVGVEADDQRPLRGVGRNLQLEEAVRGRPRNALDRTRRTRQRHRREGGRVLVESDQAEILFRRGHVMPAVAPIRREIELGGGPAGLPPLVDPPEQGAAPAAGLGDVVEHARRVAPLGLLLVSAVVRPAEEGDVRIAPARGDAELGDEQRLRVVVIVQGPQVPR